MSICIGQESDLACINRVVTEAVMAWPMPERFKRLSVPVLCYSSEDFKHYQLLLYRDNGLVVGIAAWNAQAPVLTSMGTGRLLHGLYIAPSSQRLGYGQLLISKIATEAMEAGADGLLVKAERPAITFFQRCGLQPLPAVDPTDYPYQFWYQLNQ